MIEIEHIHRIIFQSRYVRFSRKTALSIPPTPGMCIDYPFGTYLIDEVILKDGGGVTVISAERDQNGELSTVDDSSYVSYLEDSVSDEGWIILSDVKRKF